MGAYTRGSHRGRRIREEERRPTRNKSSAAREVRLGFAGYLAETDCTTKLQDDSHDRDEWTKGRIKCDISALVEPIEYSFLLNIAC